MDKVVRVLEEEVAAAEPALPDLQRRIVKRALVDLVREKSRLLPRTDALVVRTEMITDTLALL